MDYKITVTDDDGMTDFLLNPFLKTFYYNDYLVQKYPVNGKVDQIIFFDECEFFYNKVGYVLYEKKEIIVIVEKIDKKRTFSEKVINEECYISREKIESILKESTSNKFKYIKNLMQTKFEAITDYSKVVNEFRELYLQSAIYHALGTAPAEFVFNFNTIMLTDLFFMNMRNESIIDIYLGNLEMIDSFIEKTVSYSDFFKTYILYPIIFEEATAYVQKGELTEDEEMLKDYISKTKTINEPIIQVEIDSGKKIKCFNKVDCDGNIRVKNGPKLEISYKDIHKVFHNGSLIYEKIKENR